MLTAKENMRETILCRNPERYVNQYEALTFLPNPITFRGSYPTLGGPPVVNGWGVTNVWPEGTPGPFPVHTPDKIVVQDIEHWQDYVHAPDLSASQEEWDRCKAIWDAADGTRAFKSAMIAPGIFEQSHHLCEMQNALIYYMEYEDEMHDLVKYLTEYELQLAESLCSHLHPEAILHHDDWGSETNSFFRPSMFEEFFVDAYKEIYGYYHDHGVEFIVHHSDSYCANLVPDMIEMGIDVWQGCMHSNDVPALVKKYGDKITFMGEIDNKFVDFDGWTVEDCEKAAVAAIERVGTMKGFIPCITQGGPGSVYKGTYQALTDAIDRYNLTHFGGTKEELDQSRLPLMIMF